MCGNEFEINCRVEFRSCSVGSLCLRGWQIRLARKFFVCADGYAAGEAANKRLQQKKSLLHWLRVWMNFSWVILKAVRLE